jgi:hypothetical protein
MQGAGPGHAAESWPRIGQDVLLPRLGRLEGGYVGEAAQPRWCHHRHIDHAHPWRETTVIWLSLSTVMPVVPAVPKLTAVAR